MRAHVRVHGVVQGVGYRWFASRAARRLGLAGWVRNERDGSVEIAADGDPTAISAFLGEVERGPEGARVDRVEHLPADGLVDLPMPFTIQR
jgi:acylphosphatase